METSSDTTIRVSSPDHHQTLVSGLFRLLQGNRGVDCVIQWGGLQIRAHRFLLDVFLSPHNLAAGDVPEERRQCVPPDYTPLDCALQFLYKGSVDVRRELLDDLMEVARHWNFRMLIDALNSATNVGTSGTALRRSVTETTPETVESGNDMSATLQIPCTKALSLLPPVPEANGSSRPEDDAGQSGNDEQPVHSIMSAEELTTTISVWQMRCRPARAADDGSGGKDNPAPERPRKSSTVHHGDDDVVSGQQPERVFKCEVCGKPFKRRHDLKEHFRVHSGEKPYKCDECPRAFSLVRNLSHHRRCHTGERPHQCQECGKKFSLASNLLRHSRIHNGERPYQCEVCGVSFAHKESFNLHSLSHRSTESEKRPFPCPHCHLRLKSSQNLKKHLRVHTGEKPFMCVGCGKVFGYEQGLKKHERNRACGRKVGRQPKTLARATV